MKLIVINPTEAEKKDLTILEFGPLLRALAGKIVRMTPVNSVTMQSSFAPFVFRESHVRLLLANVEPKIIAIQGFAGKQINSMDDLIAHIQTVGRAIYEIGFSAKVLRNEVRQSKSTKFGIMVPYNQTVHQIQKELGNEAEIVVRNPGELIDMKVEAPRQEPALIETKESNETNEEGNQ